MKKLIAIAAVSFVCIGVLSTRAEDGGWNWRVTPYAWAAGMEGDVGVNGVTAPIDVEFTDALEDLDIAGMLSVEANNGTWGLLLDGVYMRLDGSTQTSLGKITAEVEQWIVQAEALYRAKSTDKTTFDVGAGARGMELDTDISGVVDADGTEGWVDPIIAARIRHQFAQNCFGLIYGDVGGFGVSSESTWQLIGATGYSFNDTVSLILAYRYLDYDYDEDGFVYDVATSGLALGLQFDL